MCDPRTNPRTYPQPAVELAGFVDNYLYGCVPVPECGVCEALAKELAEARLAKEYNRAYDAAAEIRNHPHSASVVRRSAATVAPARPQDLGEGWGGKNQGPK
jgi:hypothetical protein